MTACEHPQDMVEESMLGDPETERYCTNCSCVVHLIEGQWVAQRTGITSYRESYRTGEYR